MTTRTAILVILSLVVPVEAQQKADPTFRFINPKPAFGAANGPRVCIDVAHHNFQAPGQNPGSYDPLAQLLRGDGFRVDDSAELFTEEVLADCGLLMIAGALSATNEKDWRFPHPSAFSSSELLAIYQWIQRGGSLLLIVDHAPTPGAVADLGTMLGVAMLDGYARMTRPGSLPEVFTRAGGNLSNHVILTGREPSEKVESVGSWTGAAFITSREWSPLITFPQGSLGSPALFVFPPLRNVPLDALPTFPIAGWSHAAARRLEKGRVILLGEVSVCTALANGEQRVGMNHPAAGDNAQFCLNAARWLAGVLGD
jgi:hypothetical protein